jgi:N-acetylglucosamine-6-phosphate deacetylase
MKKISARYALSDGRIRDKVVIEVKDNQICSIYEDRFITEFDFEVVSPGLVDLHINGGETNHFTATPTVETLYDIEHAGLKNGTTYTLPTIITAPIETMEAAHQATIDYYNAHPQSGILGIHLEGPFLAQSKRGAHLAAYLQLPTDLLINKIIDWKYVRLLTIAPEHFTSDQLSRLVASKVKIALGHSNATFDQAQSAFTQGVNLVTHLYNAMSGFGHRDLGLVGAALYNQAVSCPIILDNLHLAKEAAQLAWRLKGENLFLISDALFQNQVKKSFQWGEFDAHYRNDTYYNSEGNLAGASISMWDAVRNAMAWFDIPLETALKLATSIPASILHTDRKIGLLETGYEAKLIYIDGQVASTIHF